MSEENKSRCYEPAKSKLVWSVILFCLVGLFLTFHPISCNMNWLDSFAPAPRPAQPARQAEAIPHESYSEVRNFQKSREVPLQFRPGSKELACPLLKGVWSREIVTPAGSRNYRIDVSEAIDHYFVWFKDGTIARISEGDMESTDFNVRRGIFRILVEEDGQSVTVTID